MNARETLRTIAAWIQLPAPPDERAAAQFAAALRLLAERIDEEEKRWPVDGLVASALARLDAPLVSP